MEKIDNNKTEYGYIEEPICNLKTNQKPPIILYKKIQTKNKKINPVCDNRQQQNLKMGLLGHYKAEKSVGELKNKFCNLLMRNGEKSKAYKLFYESLKQVDYKDLRNHSFLFKIFLKKISKEQEKLIESTKETKANKEKKDYTDQKQQQEKGYILQLKDLKGENKNNQYFQHSVNQFLRGCILYQAVENVKPPLELRRVRKGGTTYQVPAIVSQKRQERLAIKWIIESAKKRKTKSNNTFCNCLVSEILDAFNKTGQPRQRRDQQLKIAEFNRAYTRYRWW